MKELSDKYYKTLGYYCPSLFFIYLTGKGRLKTMMQWNEMQQSTFLHEYVHFLQDFITVQGLTNMYRIGEYLGYVTNVAKDSDKNEIHIPVDPMNTTGYNLKNNYQLSNWTFGEKKDVRGLAGYTKVKRGTLIEDQTQMPLDVYSIDLNCIDEKGNAVKVEFGTLQLMEGMAKEIEEAAYPNMKGNSPYNPYYIGRDVAESIMKGIGSKGDTMIALYDLSLQSSIPGYTFVMYLEEKVKQGYDATTLTADVIYNELLSKNVNHKQLGNTTFENAFNNAMKMATNVVNDLTGNIWVYNHIRYWYDTILKKGHYIRMRYPRLFIDIAGAGKINSGTLFQNLLDFLGTPLIENEEGVFESRAPKNVPIITSDMADVYAMVQTQLVFRKDGRFRCALVDYCNNKKWWSFRKHWVDERCLTTPWKRRMRFNRCPFCQWWYFKGFSKTKLLHP